MHLFRNSGITGHRGNPTMFPENTIQSFADAVAAGVDWVELDVRLSKDSKLMVIHDETTGRTCAKDLSIQDSSGADLKQLNPDLPYLEEVFELIQKNENARFSIQPKVDCVEEICNLSKSMGVSEKIAFNEGNHSLLCKARELLPECIIFYDILKTEQIEGAIKIAKQYAFNGIVVNSNAMTKENADLINSAGFETGVWVVNSPEDFMAFKKMGVERFYTDCPRKLLELIDSDPEFKK